MAPRGLHMYSRSQSVSPCFRTGTAHIERFFALRELGNEISLYVSGRTASLLGKPISNYRQKVLSRLQLRRSPGVLRLGFCGHEALSDR